MSCGGLDSRTALEDGHYDSEEGLQEAAHLERVGPDGVPPRARVALVVRPERDDVVDPEVRDVEDVARLEDRLEDAEFGEVGVLVEIDGPAPVDGRVAARGVAARQQVGVVALVRVGEDVAASSRVGVVGRPAELGDEVARAVVVGLGDDARGAEAAMHAFRRCGVDHEERRRLVSSRPLEQRDVLGLDVGRRDSEIIMRVEHGRVVRLPRVVEPLGKRHRHVARRRLPAARPARAQRAARARRRVVHEVVVVRAFGSVALRL
mmetsp:Transcript_12086/g.48656  ORF Transcript_12086/g.48656 Transcript_12086/m.48656 type:complete len:263 (-) Transcript_12086:379-1167(-)